MTEKSKPSVRKPREQKYFSMEERNSAGMDNYWHVGKRKKGFYLTVSEQGQVAGPCSTIGEALSDDARQYSGGEVKINTNISLEELFEIMNMYSFEPLLHNTDTLILNGVEIFFDSFKDVLVWYAEVCKKNK
jgi:hypothetical protein